MPGGDRTGPRGLGPMTGWGRGRCLDQPAGSAVRGAWPRGRGRGWGRIQFEPVPVQADSDANAGIIDKLQALEERLSRLEGSDESE